MRAALVPLAIVIVSTVGCLGGAEGEGEGEGDPGRTTFSWEPIAADGMQPRWGMYIAESSERAFLLGGVTDGVVDVGFRLGATDASVTASPDVLMDHSRYCHCAMLDEERDRLIVLGGRDEGFADSPTAVALGIASSSVDIIEDNGAADHPVGCQAFFFPELDRGYVFGGLSSTLGEFTNVTYRFDALTDTFTALDVTGPAARYDAGTHVLADGTAILVGGMGRATLSATFYSDVWRFDPNDETWTELAPRDAPGAPPGRRYPWTAVSPDESTLLYGYGSDSGMGSTVLGDMNAFDFASATWAPLAASGEAPSARGFTYRWPGPAGSAGVLGFGYDGTDVVTDAYVLRVPDDLAGHWH
jgi:hypothetical protein